MTQYKDARPAGTGHEDQGRTVKARDERLLSGSWQRQEAATGAAGSLQQQSAAGQRTTSALACDPLPEDRRTQHSVGTDACTIHAGAVEVENDPALAIHGDHSPFTVHRWKFFLHHDPHGFLQ